MQQKLVDVCSAISFRQFWSAGYLGVNTIIRLDYPVLTKSEQEDLDKLNEVLRPKNLEQTIITYAIDVGRAFHQILHDEFGDSYKDLQQFIRGLGGDLRNEVATFLKLRRKLVSGSSRQLFFLGQGYFQSVEELPNILDWFRSDFKNVDPECRNVGFLQGILNGSGTGHISGGIDSVNTDIELLLDDVINDEVYKDHFLSFQVAVPLSTQGLKYSRFTGQLSVKTKFI